MTAYEYKIIDGRIEEVEKRVNDLAQQGWSIAGSIHVRAFNGSVYYTQALTKPTEQRGPWN